MIIMQRGSTEMRVTNGTSVTLRVGDVHLQPGQQAIVPEQPQVRFRIPMPASNLTWQRLTVHEKRGIEE